MKKNINMTSFCDWSFDRSPILSGKSEVMEAETLDNIKEWNTKIDEKYEILRFDKGLFQHNKKKNRTVFLVRNPIWHVKTKTHYSFTAEENQTNIHSIQHREHIIMYCPNCDNTLFAILHMGVVEYYKIKDLQRKHGLTNAGCIITWYRDNNGHIKGVLNKETVDHHGNTEVDVLSKEIFPDRDFDLFYFV